MKVRALKNQRSHRKRKLLDETGGKRARKTGAKQSPRQLRQLPSPCVGSVGGQPPAIIVHKT
jgi:hypothetical protein